MTPRPLRVSPDDLNDFVEAYEAALERDGEADLADFLPPPAHPLHLPVLRELVCIEMERSHAAGRARPLPDYERDFPRLFIDLNSLQAIAYEDYRLRLQGGETIEPMEYARRFGVDVATWPRSEAEWTRASVGEPAKPPARDRTRDTPTDVLAITPHAHLFQRIRNLAIEAVEREEKVLPAAPPSARVDTPESGRCNPDLFAALYQDDPRTAFSFAEAATRLPETGARFLGFQLLEELGRGAFARVFLARQGELADRPVVLKISADVGRESRLLAQLQHTNIVPVYSIHRAGTLEAVCMPYDGTTTLADLLRHFKQQAGVPTHGTGLVTTLHECKTATRRTNREPQSSTAVPPAAPAETPSKRRAVVSHPESASRVVLDLLSGMSYVQAVLWLAARLADGLAHAHARGVVHRDLKPANVLITDEGQPMLLDFNLAEDTKVAASATAAMIGGTLPYMAPEQLRAYQERRRLIDARMDVYSLGVIIYELLAGRHPFPLREGDAPSVLPAMLADRQTDPPALAVDNPAATPAVEAILQRCLSRDPRQRYQSAGELREDLERQLAHQPLRHAREPSLRERFRKWRRRHPRLCSAGAVAALAGVLLLSVTAAYATVSTQLARHEAVAAYQRFRDRAAEVQFLLNPRTSDEVHYARGLALGRELLAEWHVHPGSDWQEQPTPRRLADDEREQLRSEIGQLLLLCARFETDPSSALAWNELALACYAQDTPRACLRQRADFLDLLAKGDEANAARQQANALSLHFAEDHFLDGRDLFAAGKLREAVPLLEEATHRDPQHFWAWLYLGMCGDAFGENDRLRECMNVCAALRPDWPGVYFNRGLSHLRQGDARRAAEDFDRAIALTERAVGPGPELADVHFNRALGRMKLGENAAAVEDLDRALALGSTRTARYFTRAQAKERLGDKAGADADRTEGMRREPGDAQSWVARGLARMARDPEGALADFEQAFAVNPRYVQALNNKAALLSQKLGRTAEAIAVLDQWLTRDPEATRAYVDRGVLHARLGQRAAAHADAQEALARSTDAPILFHAACVYAQTARTHPEDHAEAFRLLRLALRRNYGSDELDTDRDLAPLRDLPEFARLREAAKALR